MAQPKYLSHPSPGERSPNPRAPISGPLEVCQRAAVFQWRLPLLVLGLTAILLFSLGCASKPLPSPTPRPTPAHYIPPVASQVRAERAVAAINQQLRIITYNERLYAPTNIHMRMGCDHVLAASTGMQVPAWYQDMAGPGMVVAIRLIGELHHNDWQDYCRVINGAQGTWVRYGSGKWDAAIAKYGPTPAPTSSQAEHAMKAIYEEIKGPTGALPSAGSILLGCNKLLFGGGTGVIDPDKKANDEVAWIMHDRILGAAGKNWPDFCRVHGGPSSQFSAIGTGKWDSAKR